IRFEGGRGVLGHVVDARGVLVVHLEELFHGDFTAGVGGHAAHAGGDRRFDAAFDFAVGLVLDNGLDQFIPLVLVGATAIVGALPELVVGHFGEALVRG